ncbi:MAG: excinuclease ABC subunit UvrC [Candidatus Buchananbacteria bacterium]|nr:excinuclease ABC subunit UvrC [Candidatus Buchananbacteria bacterium]
MKNELYHGTILLSTKMSNLKQKIKDSPQNPGCYIFKDKNGRIIYIGKAKNISKRVKSYFHKYDLDSKTVELVKKISDVDFFITDNELEAFLLEARLINKHQPKYNIELKAGKRYAHLLITNEEYPRLVAVRSFKNSDEVYGPYASGQARQELVRIANRLFKMRVNKRMTKKEIQRGRIKLATSPWSEEISQIEYRQRVDRVRLLLKGQNEELIKKLQSEMHEYAAQNNFEQAKIRRDQIMALENIAQKQKIELRRNYDQDVINYIQTPNKLVVQLFNINKGIISGRKEFTFQTPLSTEPAVNLADFLSQYYYTQDIPQEIILPIQLADQNILEQYFSNLAGHRLKIIVPQKGDKLKLLELVKKNIEINLQTGEANLFELQNVLGLTSSPRIIEAFDISNLGPSDVVASMVRFDQGKPDKDNYRRFKIKTFQGQSDFDAMKEVVYRRYYRITKQQEQLPDLIMVDGGKPQLSAARQSLSALGLDQIPLIALAKKEEEIYTLKSKYPIRLSKRSSALKLLQRIRDEAHRFAITYQRSLRLKRQ